MSAPQTDIDKQARRHRGPLRGMFAVVLFALVLLAFLAFWAFGRGGVPEGAETQIQSGLGVEEEDVGTVGFVEEDPTAVTVPAETVTAPQVGTGMPFDTDPGESQAAEPLEPIDDAAVGTVVVAD